MVGRASIMQEEQERSVKVRQEFLRVLLATGTYPMKWR
jgi:hypothetical protein